MYLFSSVVARSKEGARPFPRNQRVEKYVFSKQYGANLGIYMLLPQTTNPSYTTAFILFNSDFALFPTECFIAVSCKPCPTLALDVTSRPASGLHFFVYTISLKCTCILLGFHTFYAHSPEVRYLPEVTSRLISNQHWTKVSNLHLLSLKRLRMPMYMIQLNSLVALLFMT